MDNNLLILRNKQECGELFDGNEPHAPNRRFGNMVEDDISDNFGAAS